MLKGRDACRGAAMVEFQVVATLALLPLCLGMLQLVLLVAENHHLDLAAFHAARRAAMEQGDLGPARRALAQAASVLFIEAGDDAADNLAGRAASAYARALADQARFARVRLLSPDESAQQDFAELRGGQRVIPNDGLQYRSPAPGRRSGLSIQQANILRLEVNWCRPLIVPLARELLLGALRNIDLDPWHQYCYAEGRVPIRSESATPMQSDFRVSS
jgi:hypothetical protein